MTHLRWLGTCLLLALAFSPAAAAQDGARVALGGSCNTDADCDDHVYCNGAELCNGTCTAGTPVYCGTHGECSDVANRCLIHYTDADGDGHNTFATDGDDCDDNDVRRFPGNPEVWDDADHDEDCDLRTHGLPPGNLFGGANRVGPVQVCSGPKVIVMTGVVGGQEAFREVDCPAGSACAVQPSGDGACQPAGPGYMAPPVLAHIPFSDQARPPEPNPVQRGLAQPAPIRPLAPAAAARPTMVLPAAPRPSTPVALPPSRAKVACPKDQAYSVAAGKCIPIPPL